MTFRAVTLSSGLLAAKAHPHAPSWSPLALPPGGGVPDAERVVVAAGHQVLPAPVRQRLAHPVVVAAEHQQAGALLRSGRGGAGDS